MVGIGVEEKNIGRKDLFLAIHQIARDINSTIGLNQCLKAILDRTTALLEVEMASLMLINKAKNELSIRYAKGLKENIVKEAREFLDQKDPREIAAWVAQRGEPLLIQDIEKDGRFLKRNGKKYVNNSLLSVPLKVKDEVIGVLNVNNKKNKGMFTQEDLDILTTLADEVSIAIQNNRLYEELVDANERLQELDQLKSDFVANVSHELNTPLATSRYLVSVLEKGIAGQINAKQKEFLALIGNNIDRLTRLIENLLNISRIESGKFELKRELLELAVLIKEAVGSFKAQSEAKSVALNTALPNVLPKVYVDRDRIIQVLVNLLDNALKFTKEGGKVTISSEILKKAAFTSDMPIDFVEVCVSDTGVGIASEDIDKLFTKFQRVSHKLDAAKIKGTGLGLAITKDIVEAHKGRVWVESNVGVGSKFFFTLPVYNEPYFLRDYLDQQIKKASENKSSVSLLLFDLAPIKKLNKQDANQQIFHIADAVYKIAKNNIRRPEDLVHKFKDESRVLVIAEADKAGAAVLIDRVLKDVKAHKIKEKNGRQIYSKVRTVVLAFPEDGLDGKELFEKLNYMAGH